MSLCVYSVGVLHKVKITELYCLEGYAKTVILAWHIMRAVNSFLKYYELDAEFLRLVPIDKASWFAILEAKMTNESSAIYPIIIWIGTRIVLVDCHFRNHQFSEFILTWIKFLFIIHMEMDAAQIIQDCVAPCSEQAGHIQSVPLKVPVLGWSPMLCGSDFRVKDSSSASQRKTPSAVRTAMKYHLPKCLLSKRNLTNCSG